ncbi:hypothetical protein, partial [Senegalimassilia anaerobia]|uniref:hypothetical protein n=1 Tax=Senegalimassilia anaerobia TaxID=1473216 RepID=UPI00248ECB2D
MLRVVDYEDEGSLATVFPKWLSRAQKDCFGAARYISLTGWYRAGKSIYPMMSVFKVHQALAL